MDEDEYADEESESHHKYAERYEYMFAQIYATKICHKIISLFSSNEIIILFPFHFGDT